MLVLSVLSDFVDQCSRVLKTAGGLQNQTRTELIKDLQGICDRCETAYGRLIVNLVPVKNAFYDRQHLVDSIRSFIQNSEVRDSFKPANLCGEAVMLLDRLANNLDPLKYSVDFRKIAELKESLKQFGNYDLAFYRTFDDFANDLGSLATTLANPGTQGDELNERMAYTRTVIEDFEREVSELVRSVQSALRRLVAA